jgi:hypothetical protein
MSNPAKSATLTAREAAAALGISVRSLWAAVASGVLPKIETGVRAMPKARSVPVFGTLTMPNGQTIRTMREDAFQAALAGSGNKPVR